MNRGVEQDRFSPTGKGALTDKRERVDGRSRSERGNGSPQLGMQGGGDPPQTARILASNPKADLAWI